MQCCETGLPQCRLLVSWVTFGEVSHNADRANVDLLQAQACLKLLPDGTAAAAELAFIQGIEHLQDYGISLSPTELFRVRDMRDSAACISFPS